MKVYTVMTVVLAILAILPEADAIWSHRSTNCRVSTWSEWSSPEGFGTITRERTILRYPSIEGATCPALKETKETNVLPSPEETATSMVTHFFRLKSHRRRKRQEEDGPVRDLLIIIDSSGSIGASDFELAKDQIARLLGLFCPLDDPFKLDKSYQHHRVALVHYSTAVIEEFDFDDNEGLAEVQRHIRGLQYMSQGTCTGAAFRKAQSMFDTTRGMRKSPNVVQEVLILTDGLSSRCGGITAIEAAQNLKDARNLDVRIFGLMVGRFTTDGREELSSYVSSPPPEHLFAVTNYGSLAAVVDLVETTIKGGVPCGDFD